MTSVRDDPIETPQAISENSSEVTPHSSHTLIPSSKPKPTIKYSKLSNFKNWLERLNRGAIVAIIVVVKAIMAAVLIGIIFGIRMANSRTSPPKGGKTFYLGGPEYNRTTVDGSVQLSPDESALFVFESKRVLRMDTATDRVDVISLNSNTSESLISHRVFNNGATFVTWSTVNLTVYEGYIVNSSTVWLWDYRRGSLDRFSLAIDEPFRDTLLQFYFVNTTHFLLKYTFSKTDFAGRKNYLSLMSLDFVSKSAVPVTSSGQRSFWNNLTSFDDDYMITSSSNSQWLFIGGKVRPPVQTSNKPFVFQISAYDLQSQNLTTPTTTYNYDLYGDISNGTTLSQFQIVTLKNDEQRFHIKIQSAYDFSTPYIEPSILTPTVTGYMICIMDEIPVFDKLKETAYAVQYSSDFEYAAFMLDVYSRNSPTVAITNVGSLDMCKKADTKMTDQYVLGDLELTAKFPYEKVKLLVLSAGKKFYLIFEKNLIAFAWN
ncbi:hypothetical protein HK098_004576 [Nowakowskiella sp. JEL0407]|nr:hypothetical protein HK098_004576 [Nowakowskiella sp. JEL0407]